ncbi:conserved hypothetical protein [Novosphingobium aromaticivorans DSM 12444]|uniref:Methyltransferase type 11 n=1 Tax=Novosphingobium aromaticivorans (strain ATCC 700278 / DSM 12444 / CCUG 56034 / CIP 105152 / NBRC 16084 / F199) TaxID=279238 RepID=Q2G3A6_NOVAD|nr:class I SAM-dependent methyltransferase [Novosphingobium aromaticivorans]ABD27667.1 conserved hypothetical protein [Novosphingobium aromaticivorans DSM 12444]SCY30980.1 Methyltransferase domain-containing protein [Novosphingobium aromaticivorans]
MLESVSSCAYCGESAHERASSDVEDWFFHNVEGGFDFERCNGCGSLWMSRRLAPQDLPRAYASYYTHAVVDGGRAERGIKGWLRDCYVRTRFGGRSGPVERLGAAVYRRLAPGLVHLDAMHRFAPPAPARILDYGCGGGTYLRQMRALGYDVTGVDFDPVTIAPLKAEGIAAFSTDEVAQQDWAEAFDCITINHVIEHVADPIALVQQLAGMLKPGGRLYCEAPNAHATGLDVFGRYWRGLEAPRHLTVPSSDGLRRVLAAAGLEEERSMMRDWVRSLTWPLSLDAVPPDERTDYERKAAEAAPHTLANSEYLIVVARKGCKS